MIEQENSHSQDASETSMHPVDYVVPIRSIFLRQERVPGAVESLREILNATERYLVTGESLSDMDYLNLATTGSFRGVQDEDAEHIRLNNLLMGRENPSRRRMKSLNALRDSLISYLNMEHDLWTSLRQAGNYDERAAIYAELWKTLIGEIQPHLDKLDLGITLFDEHQDGKNFMYFLNSGKTYYPLESYGEILHGSKEFTTPKEILDWKLQGQYWYLIEGFLRAVNTAQLYSQREVETEKGARAFDPFNLRLIFAEYFTDEERVSISETCKQMRALSKSGRGGLDVDAIRDQLFQGESLVTVAHHLTWSKLFELSAMREEYNMGWALVATQWK